LEGSHEIIYFILKVGNFKIILKGVAWSGKAEALLQFLV
jgi:hypothetical protein